MAAENHDGDDRAYITIHEVARMNPNEEPKLSRELMQSRTQASSETGYMMRFGDERHSRLTPFDVVQLTGKSYPVPRMALESLPSYVRAQLDQDGAVQVIAEYDSEDGVFKNISLDWDDRSFIEHTVELMALSDDVSFLKAADYVVRRRGGAVLETGLGNGQGRCE